MANPGIAMFYAILMFIIYSSSAQSECDLGLNFDTISRNNIGISWNKTCYNHTTSYTVELLKEGEVDPCSSTKICDGPDTLCATDVTEMSCSVSSCENVNMKVIGGEVEHSRNITTAPYFRSSEWNLAASIDNMLTVSWGPITGDQKDCATDVKITANCVDHIINETRAVDPASDAAFTEDLSLDGCSTGNVTDVTVTYMSGDIPTETKETSDDDGLYYFAPTTTEAPTTTPEPTTSAPTTTEALTTTPESPPSEPPKEKKLSGGAIAGIVIGSLVGAALLGVGIFFLVKWMKENDKCCC